VTNCWTISARPIYGQDLEACLGRDEIEEAHILTSYPGVLDVWLQPGTPESVAQEIAECLRALPGEPLEVTVTAVPTNRS
jgi:hypothetical protein